MSQKRGNLRETLNMIAHPWATLRKVQRLDRLPDRRVSRTPGAPSRDSTDPLRVYGQAKSLYRALGVYALEESRVELYENYREMDTDPMIASVLDAFGDDAGQFDPEHKRVVWVEGNNQDIVRILTRTLDRLHIDSLAFPILRTLARDGDVMEHVALARGEGALALRNYEPWTVARVEDDIGRLIGFAPANDVGDAVRKESNTVPPYKVLHFRLPSRQRINPYGAASSFLWGSRIVWRQLQLMEDQVVIQRLLRRPDRLLILMDATGMSYDEAWQTVKEWESRWHREVYLNPGASEFRSHGAPIDGAQDMILPRGPNNQTSIENFPATNQNDLLRDLDLFLARLAAGIGFPLGFIGRDERGTYQPGQSLSRQYQPFAKRAARLQRAFLTELVRLCQIDLAFKGLDPYREENAFSLNMATVSPIVEIERAEVVQLRMDRMERAIRLGQDAQLNLGVWIPFVLEKYGGLPRDLVEQLYAGGGEGEQQSPFESRKHPPPPPDRKALDEAMGQVMPNVEDESRVCSTSVSIEGIGYEVEKGKYTPNALNEAATDLKGGDDPLAKTLSERANKQFVSSRRKRMETRVSLISTLAALPEVPQSEWRT